MHRLFGATGRPEAPAALLGGSEADEFLKQVILPLRGGGVRASRVPHRVHVWAYKEARYTLEDGPELNQHSLEGLDTGTPALTSWPWPDVGAERCPGVGGGRFPLSWSSISGPDKPPGSRASTQKPRGWDGPHGPAHSGAGPRAEPRGAGLAPRGHSSSLGLQEIQMPA